MIASFRCAETEKVFRREKSRRFSNIQRVALRRLIALDAARKLSDLAGVGMSLEALKEDRSGQHSIRINDKYRICFLWSEGNVFDVEIVDYHQRREAMAQKSPIAPVHPGEILLEDFMKPAGISINGLALELRVPATRISAIVNEARGITADTAMRLGRYFSTTPEFWMNLQSRYDLDVAADESRKEIERSVRPRNAA